VRQAITRIVLALACGWLASAAWASDITAASCANTSGATHVQDAVNTAVTGDRVLIPTGACTWTIPVSASGKGITLRAAADCDPLSDVTPPIAADRCSTVITINVGNQPGIDLQYCSATNPVDVSHLSIKVPAGWSNLSGMVYVHCDSAGGTPVAAARVHHNEFNCDVSGASGRWLEVAAIAGLVDHNNFHSGAGSCGNVSAVPDGQPGSQIYAWHHAFARGDANCLYIEDNFFYSSIANQGNGATDNYMMCYVFRMNTVYNNNVGHHGPDSQLRGVWRAEILGNVFKAESGITSIPLFQPRSGSAIVGLNTVENLTGASPGYASFHTLLYYGAWSPAEAWYEGGLWYSQRPDRIYYPATPWSTYSGSITSIDMTSNYVGYGVAKSTDGNQFGSNTFESACSRTITSVNSTAGNAVVTASGGAFQTNGTLPDTKASMYSTLFKPGSVKTCSVTSGNAQITCSGANFEVDKDEGRHVSSDDRATFGGSARGTRISTVDSATQVTLVAAPDFSGGARVLVFGDPFVVSVDSATQVTMSVPALSTGTGGTMTIGCSHQGYPLMDQGGRGAFASANVGNWPNSASYTDANFEQLLPDVTFGNNWRGTPGGSWTNPPASFADKASSAGYFQPNRDFYNPVDYAVEPASAFDGSAGAGIGPIANRPASCVTGVYFWAVDEGNWNAGSFTYTYPNGGTTRTQGVLYRCETGDGAGGNPDTWVLDYTPYCYPHQLITGAPCPSSGTSRRSRVRARGL
jgi:hypothetical protein